MAWSRRAWRRARADLAKFQLRVHAGGSASASRPAHVRPEAFQILARHRLEEPQRLGDILGSDPPDGEPHVDEDVVAGRDDLVHEVERDLPADPQK
jgi:hypothetical protein